MQNQSVNTSQNNSLSPPLTIVKNRSQCDSQETGAPWVRINPVGDHHVGDLLTINGSTNLPQGSTLIISIFSTNDYNKPMHFNSTAWCIHRCLQADVTITNEICPYNNFSMVFNTTNLFADEYWVWAILVNDSSSEKNNLMTKRIFNIT
jgi:hypothetical protein